VPSGKRLHECICQHVLCCDCELPGNHVVVEVCKVGGQVRSCLPSEMLLAVLTYVAGNLYGNVAGYPVAALYPMRLFMVECNFLIYIAYIIILV